MAVNTAKQSVNKQRDAVAPTAPSVFDFDIYLVLVVSGLVAFGLLMVYSTTFDWSYLEFGSPISIFLRQVRSLIVGLIALVIAWRIDYRWLRDRRIATLIMLITILVLGVLLLIDNEVLGAQRSLLNGSIQPGEPAKLAVIIYFAAWLSSRRDKLHKIGYGLLPFSVLIGAVGGLIVLQPDLSTAALIMLIVWTMFFLAGANIFQILLAGGGATVVGWLVTTQFGYARTRLQEHIVAMSDLTQASWHVQQAIIAFTAPGTRAGSVFTPNWFGVGLGQSRQKFGFLPAPHTDSIFAIVGEELGLIGCFLLIALYVLFVWRAFRISSKAPDFFGSLVASGVGSWIAYEALLNISVMTAVVPFTGVPLPFISYGGSSLVSALAGVGLLMSISRERLRRIEQRPQAAAPSMADVDLSVGRKAQARPRRRNR